MSIFTPQNWYWTIGGDVSQVFAGARGVLVPANDAAYQVWLAAGNFPTPIDSIVNLAGVLAPYRLRPTDAAMLAAYQQAVANSLDIMQLHIMFNHENRIRTLEGKVALTQAQFIAAIVTLL